MNDCEYEHFAEASYSLQDWHRMKDMHKAVRSSQKSRELCATKMNASVTSNGSYRETASRIQDKEISLEILRDDIRHARRRLRNTQLRYSAFLDRLTDDKNEESTRRNELDALIENVNRLLVKNNEMRFRYHHYNIVNELILRRRFMIFGLYRVFFFRPNPRCLSKNKCYCEHFDEIRGLHLPQIKARQGHSDKEMAAALGTIVCLIQSLCKIIGYTTIHRLHFGGSRSTIAANGDQIYPLYPVTSRKQKERETFDVGLRLLNDTILELWTQSGMTNADADRPIRNLREFCLACLGLLRPTFIRSPRDSPSPFAQLVWHPDRMDADGSDDANGAVSREMASNMVRFLSVDDNEVAGRENPNSPITATSMLDVISSR